MSLSPQSWEAWQVDVATLQAGRWIEGKLAERDKEGRPVWSIEKLLAGNATKSDGFASLKGRARKVRIKPDGTWD